MSDEDPPIPPPTPGTIPFLRRDEAPSLRPHREEGNIAQADRRRGRWTHTEQARTARVDVVAREMAAGQAGTDQQLASGLAGELLGQMEANLAEEVGRRAAGRTTAESQVQTSVAAAAVATTRAEEADLALRRARTAVPEPPVGGTAFIHKAIPFVVLPVLGYLELRMGAPGLSAALKISSLAAELTALAIAAALIIAADALGLAIGGSVRGSRDAARRMLVLLGCALVLAGAWTVVSLASSRTDNLQYRECGKELEEARSRQLEATESTGLGSLTKKGQAAGEATAATSPPVSAQCKGSKPDLGFTVPLALLAMLASAMLAMRVAVASEWREARERLKDAETRHQETAQARDTAQIGRPGQNRPLEQSELELGVSFERETQATEGFFARLSAEYLRWCSVFSHRPVALALPPVPEPAGLMARMLGPRAPTAPAAEPQPGPERGSGLPGGARPEPPDPGGDEPDGFTAGHADGEPAGACPAGRGPDGAGPAGSHRPEPSGAGNPDDGQQGTVEADTGTAAMRASARATAPPHGVAPGQGAERDSGLSGGDGAASGGEQAPAGMDERDLDVDGRPPGYVFDEPEPGGTGVDDKDQDPRGVT
jgi:hypothetical protein